VGRALAIQELIVPQHEINFPPIESINKLSNSVSSRMQINAAVSEIQRLEHSAIGLLCGTVLNVWKHIFERKHPDQAPDDHVNTDHLSACKRRQHPRASLYVDHKAVALFPYPSQYFSAPSEWNLRCSTHCLVTCRPSWHDTQLEFDFFYSFALRILLILPWTEHHESRHLSWSRLHHPRNKIQA